MMTYNEEQNLAILLAQMQPIIDEICIADAMRDCYEKNWKMEF